MHEVKWHVYWWSEGDIVRHVSGNVHGHELAAVWVQAASVAAGAALVHPARPQLRKESITLRLDGPGGFPPSAVKKVVDSAELFEVVHTVDTTDRGA